MSTTGGGLIVLAGHQQFFPAKGGTKIVTITNASGSDLTLTQAQIDALADQYCPDPYMSVGLSWNGTSYSVITGPDE